MRQLQATLTRLLIVLESESHEIEKDFPAKIGNLNDFSAQNQVISKKKKVFTKIETDFLAKLGNSNGFLTQKQVISKKNLGQIFRPKSEIHRFFRPNHGNYFTTSAPKFLWGGLFSFFQQKLSSKTPKTCDFAYFTGQWGGSSPPPPPH